MASTTARIHLLGYPLGDIITRVVESLYIVFIVNCEITPSILYLSAGFKWEPDTTMLTHY